MTIIDETNFTAFGTEVSRGRLVLGDRLPELPARVDLVAVVWCHEGEASVLLNNQRRLFAAGDLLFVTPSSLLAEADLARCRVSVVFVSRAELYRATLHHRAADLLQRLRTVPVTHLSPEGQRIAESFLQLTQILLAARQRSYSQEVLSMLADSYVYEILNLVADGMESMGPWNALFLSFIDMAEKGRGHLRNVGDMAQHLCVSPKYLAHVVKENSGMTPTEWLDIFTLQAIVHQLRYTNRPLKEIASDMGFPNTSSFGTYVKHHLGITPAAYRRQHRTVEVNS